MYKVSFLLVATIALNACNAKTVSDAEFPVESVMLAQYQEPSDVILYKPVENGDVFTMQTINTPLSDTTFDGVAVKRTKSAIILKQNGKVLDSSESLLYFQVSPLKYIGSTSNDEYETASGETSLPKTAKIGDSGKIHKSNSWRDDSKKTPISDTVVSWTLIAANDNTAWLCEDIEIYYLAEDKPDAKGSACVEINPKGEMLNHKVSVSNVVDGEVREIVFVSK